jgi:2-keto-3-deoxy-L-rhamnonate aldolase RhmA
MIVPQLYAIAQPSSVDIKRALDIGPCQAVVPNVRNVNEAHHGVDAADTVPKGIAAHSKYPVKLVQDLR